MAGYGYQDFLNSLKKLPDERTQEDLKILYTHLHGMGALSSLREASLRSLCKTVRYEKHDANDILYCRGELSSCWYILLSGSVFIDGSMFLPRSSFGKRTAGGGRRVNECLILESSEMIAIDYPDVQLMRPGQRQSCTTMNLEKLLALEQDEVSVEPRPHRLHMDGTDVVDHRPHHHIQLSEYQPVQTMLHRGENLLKSNRSSHGSDTSSAYSGSDTMQSVQSSLEDQEVDLSGLMESAVDSDDEEDLAELIDSLTVRDTVRECLEKDSSERTDDDIEVLLELMQHLPAFANMTLAVRRALCAVMVFAVVEKAGTVVMNDGEELDSWSVIVNGQVEVELPDGNIQELHFGDSFGITATTEKMYHQGTMRTKVDDCQFVCIAQSDYHKILHQGEENTKKHEEDGQVILVTERRILDGGSRQGHVVIRGTSDSLMAQLVEENTLDPSYVEDFLLTHRTFISSPLVVANNLLTWFKDHQLRDKVTRVVLLWINYHFPDFEMDADMMEFLEKFESVLEQEKMQSQLRLLNIACATKARSRTITLARSTRDDVLHFSILGGYERGFGIFISKVNKGSKAEDVGLRRGDQILEVNGQSFEHVSHARALEILRGTTHLSITVRSNLLAFKEMLNTPENSPRQRGRKVSEIARLQSDPRARLSSHFDWGDIKGEMVIPLELGVSALLQPPNSPPPQCLRTSSGPVGDGKQEKKGFKTLSNRGKIKKALAKMNIIHKSGNSESQLNSSDDSLYSLRSGSSNGSTNHHRTRAVSPKRSSGSGSLYHSHSNPDLASLSAYYEPELRPDFPEHVLKVYRADQTFKYLLIHKETTAREVVMLSLREFGITDPSSKYSLCEVTCGEGGVIKQRRLPDQMHNLAERIGLSSRYYLKNNSSTEALVPDDLAGELLRESQVHFLQLNSVEIATQLTLEDFSIFCQIEPTEYIDDLFDIKSRYGTPKLSKFGELVNREMFWVVTEVCSEPNHLRRMKIIKQFIKVARQCKECKNFNSMFAILSGLDHGAVSRLRSAWEKLPSKYSKMFKDLSDLMDPSRNMCKYRTLISSEHTHPPMIPFYPVVKKDLTFIHLGNDTKVEGLVNFEKLRMVAKEVRQLLNMCSAPYDLFNMLELGGANPSSAMASLNSFATTTNAATVKRRKKSTPQPHPKKMFEEAQMVRRVKTYLANLKVITDEDLLRSMSVECEPMTGAGVASIQPRKRNPSPTLSTASSNSSTSEGKKSINSGRKFGTESPQAVRKMLALSDHSKLRPHQPNRHSHSPSPSPNTARRWQDNGHGHGRSHSDTHNPSMLPVDLSAESSSVTSLNQLPLRKSQTSDSSSGGSCRCHHGYEVDSGHNSVGFDSHSNSSIGSANSPPQHRRSHYMSHSSPPVINRMRTNAPYIPHGIQVLPPIPPGPTGLPSSSVLMPPPPPPRDSHHYPLIRARRPLDYPHPSKAMPRGRHMGQLARAHSHDGMTSVGYYNADATDPDEDEDEETQVSAV
ncbi:rap guanine nucleotide exchange factor 6-like isoform X4 [Limulus polyphemus]|uniref:Rap guanine nucleotide exchange factor 6-like isoform X4 n=1 Tax=Limulus polyphemus TaxID=6850 RepID=A0ABM1STI2_LIMPO|nr:rap guanine nucleotide exchange factor 6-like isoform X4 [Limulus polyphemus]